MIIHDLEKQGHIHPPKFLADNTHLIVVSGSMAYGVGDPKTSDSDCYGFCLPPKDVVFPHTAGYIAGFGTQPPAMEVWTEHGKIDDRTGKEYDFSIYNIVKYFDLLLGNNPNMVDSLFVPERCVIHATKIGQRVRESRHMFLHKGSYHRFKGYAYAQLKKLRGKQQSDNPKRQATIDAHGFDTKHAFHIVRLALECEDILETGDLHLDQNAVVLAAIRNGEWTLERLEQWFQDKEISLEKAYSNSTLRAKADEEAIKTLLIECLEMHYGSLGEAALVKQSDTDKLIREIRSVLDRHG